MLSEQDKKQFNEFRKEVHEDKIKLFDEMVKLLENSSFDASLGCLNLSFYLEKDLTDIELEKVANYLEKKCEL